MLRVFLIVAIFWTIAAPEAAEESLGTKMFLSQHNADLTKTSKRSAKKSTPSPSPTASPKRKSRRLRPSPTQAAKSNEKRSPTLPGRPHPLPDRHPGSSNAKSSVTPSPTETPHPAPTPSPTAKTALEKKGAPNVTILPDKIESYDAYPLKVRRIIESGLELTKQNLDYTYGSADPANGGMDCSGFIYYVLRQNGFTDVPRDSSQQYVWVRKAENFHAVLSRRADSFELDALKPGDLLFWTGTYSIDRDPPVTHTMIYLGHEKGTNKPIMVGASDGRTYDGKQRFGVSVFDFKLSKPPDSNDVKLSPVFVGYGRIPGLSDD
jgi:cell wall-associated NlpC family hydrolase